MERFSQDFLRAVRRENVLCKRLWVWLEFVVTGWSKVTFFFTLYIKVGGGGGGVGGGGVGYPPKRGLRRMSVGGDEVSPKKGFFFETEK